ncbi:MAG: porin [Saprospiraceae bacterium]|nr:porin [Saprospiraceae bacterium]
MKNPYLITLAALISAALPLVAQEVPAPTLTFGGYIEPFYAYDFNQPEDGNRPSFLYSFNRHNEFNVNLGMLKANYSARRLRANAALAAGTYMNANYAAEPGVLQNIYEMNAGIKISDNSDLWVDGGIFPSHIGFESAIGKDCRTLTRSMVAENTPYYEAGARITYNTPNGQWLLSGLALNGWQRIQRVPGNSLPSFGTQVQFKPNSRTLLNYSTFIGTDKPDSTRQMRYHNNLYGVFQLSDRWELTANLDVGFEEKSPENSDLNVWYTPVVIVRYAPTAKDAVALRFEYFSDENGVIINTGTPNGFGVTGVSLNYDRAVLPNALWRVEGRLLNSADDAIFVSDGDAVNANFCLTTSIAISF